MNTERPFRGGRVFTDDEAPLPTEIKPIRLRYPCFAAGCPMPGTLFPGIVLGGAGGKPGTCVYHYAAIPGDIPRVTRALQDWDCVAREIDRARKILTSPETATDAQAQNQEFALAWGRLQPMLEGGGWRDALLPNGRSYGDWAKDLERFLGARVVEVLAPPGSRRR